MFLMPTPRTQPTYEVVWNGARDARYQRRNQIHIKVTIPERKEPKGKAGEILAKMRQTRDWQTRSGLAAQGYTLHTVGKLLAYLRAEGKLDEVVVKDGVTTHEGHVHHKAYRLKP